MPAPRAARRGVARPPLSSTSRRISTARVRAGDAPALRALRGFSVAVTAGAARTAPERSWPPRPEPRRSPQPRHEGLPGNRLLPLALQRPNGERRAGSRHHDGSPELEAQVARGPAHPRGPHVRVPDLDALRAEEGEQSGPGGERSEPPLELDGRTRPVRLAVLAADDGRPRGLSALRLRLEGTRLDPGKRPDEEVRSEKREAARKVARVLALGDPRALL